MEEALGQSELTSAAREVRARLAPYSLTAAKALCLWPGQPLDEDHRHPSHLMAIHPAMDLTIEGGEVHRLVKVLQEYDWAKLAERMRDFDVRRSVVRVPDGAAP